MRHKKLFNSKAGKGLVSLIAVIILLSSILATTVYYEGSLTANVIREIPTAKPAAVPIKEAGDISELGQLNEGWYEIRNGFVFYLDTFNSYAPLYIRVKNQGQQNGLLVVDANGDIEFENGFVLKRGVRIFNEKDFNEEEEDATENKKSASLVTGYSTIGVRSVEEGGKVLFYATLNGVNLPNNDIIYDNEGNRYKVGYTSGWLSSKAYAESIDENENPTGSIIPLVSGNWWSGIKVVSSQDFYLTNPVPPEKPAYAEKAAYTDGEGLPAAAKEAQHPQAVTIRETDEIKEFRFEIKYNNEPVVDNKGNKIISSQMAVSEAEAIMALGLQPGYTAIPATAMPANEQPKEAVQTISEEPNLMQFGNFYHVTYGGKSFPATTDKAAAEKTSAELKIFHDLKKHNPDLSEDQLWKLYLSPKQKQYGDEAAAKQIAAQLGIQIDKAVPQEESAEPEVQAPAQLRGKDGKLIEAWRLADGSIEEDKNKVNRIIQEQFAEKSLKEQKLTSLNKADEQGWQLARKGERVYRFVPVIENGQAKGGKFIEVNEAEYTSKETIGEGSDAVEIFESYETKTGRQTGIKITKEGKSAMIDEESLKKIRETGGKGLSVDAAAESSILEFKDPGTNEISERITLSRDYAKESGRKTIEKFKTVFLDKSGKEVMADKARQLQEKGEVLTKKTVHAFRQDEERKGGKVEFLTYYSYSLENGMETHEAIKKDIKSGNIVEFRYGREGKEIIFKDAKGISSTDIFSLNKIIDGAVTDEKLKADALSSLRQTLSRQFFATVERALTEFQGLGYYATLFFDDESLLRWRDNVDRAFAAAFLGTEYWSSSICSRYIDGEDEGIAYAETPQGLAQVGAHIEATRTEPVYTDKGLEFIYKITFNVRNGDYGRDPRAPEEMNINIILKGESTATVFKQEQKVKRGDQFGKVGREAIVQDSTIFYNEVCLTFDEFPLRWKLENNELCNIIQESSGEAVAISDTTASKPAVAAPMSAAEAPAAESSINDF